MALETLKDVKEIDGFEVGHFYPNSQTDPDPLFKHIRIHHRFNGITFNIQKGPIKEVGVNGCQVDTLVDTAFQIIAKLNGKFPCDENTEALGHLAKALAALKMRKLNREKRGVEGTNQV